MDQTFLRNLAKAVEEDPGSGLCAAAMEQVAWESLERLQRPDQVRLSEGADQTAALAQRWFAIASQNANASLAWYAGQVQSLALLMRAALLREIPFSVQALLGQKNTSAFLRALEEGDTTLSKLAETVGMDLSQAQREVSRMADHDLVRTIKRGRDRWVRLTNLGYRSLASSRADSRRAGQSLVQPHQGSMQHAPAPQGPSDAVALPEWWVAVSAQQEAARQLVAIAGALQDAAKGLSEGAHELRAGRPTAPQNTQRPEGVKARLIAGANKVRQMVHSTGRSED